MKWIPTREIVPDKGGMYLVQLTWTDRPEVLDYFPADEYENDIWVSSEGITYRTNQIEAWMELPKPYHEPTKKEKKEND